MEKTTKLSYTTEEVEAIRKEFASEVSKVIGQYNELSKTLKEIKDKDLNSRMGNLSDKEQLDYLIENSKTFKAKALEIQNTFEALSDAEKSEYLEQLANEFNDPEIKSLVASDLPLSEVLTNLSIRVVEQIITKTALKYPMMNLLNITNRQNGVFDIFYRDYRDNFVRKGTDNVVIGDFNQGINPIVKETAIADIYTSNGFDQLSSLLNDTMINVGNFATLLGDFGLFIARPLAREMYQMVIKSLNTTENYNELITFADNDTKLKAKEIANKILSIKTPSRTHLKSTISGLPRQLEYNSMDDELVLLISSKYATDYNYDFTANVYQLGEIKINVSAIEVVDFTQFKGY
jgi:hypothetical protein